VYFFVPVCENFVDLVELLELLGDVLESPEPARVAALLEELEFLDFDKVAALVARRGHDGDVVAVVGGQGAVAPQDEALRPSEHLHVRRVVTHRLLNPLQLAAAQRRRWKPKFNQCFC